MDISDTRKCNRWNLKQLAGYLDDTDGRLESYYDELLADGFLLDQLNAQMERVRATTGFRKAILGRGSLTTVDWFAFERVLLYVLVRFLKPSWILETGVYYGGNTAFLLAGLHANRAGRLVSIDLPMTQMDDAFLASRHPDVGDSELYTEQLAPGFIIPEYLRDHWEFVAGDSREQIPLRDEPFEMFVHDSEHSHDFVFSELTLVSEKLTPDAMIVADDIDWSNGFFAYCVQRRLLPLLLTDNGKDDLRVRMGVVKLDHARNTLAEATGRKTECAL